jgi:hypothetical protein
VPERNWSDPAQIQWSLEQLEKLKHDVETRGNSVTEGDEKKSAGFNPLIESAMQAMRALAKAGGGPLSPDGERELRHNAEEMTAALDEVLPAVPLNDIAASAGLIVEGLAENPADTQRVLAELAKLRAGLAGLMSRLVLDAIAGRVASDRQGIANIMKANVEVSRLARDLMAGLKREPVDIGAVHVQAKSLREATEHLAGRKAE